MYRKFFSLSWVAVALLAGTISFSACNKDKGDGGDTEDGPADAGIKKAQELCDCFKKASEAEGKACVEVVNEKAEYLKYEENASFQEAFDKELGKCDAETPAWW